MPPPLPFSPSFLIVYSFPPCFSHISLFLFLSFVFNDFSVFLYFQPLFLSFTSPLPPPPHFFSFFFLLFSFFLSCVSLFMFLLYFPHCFPFSFPFPFFASYISAFFISASKILHRPCTRSTLPSPSPSSGTATSLSLTTTRKSPSYRPPTSRKKWLCLSTRSDAAVAAFAFVGWGSAAVVLLLLLMALVVS